jgi:F0F1-type ATP synthase assembly protein I
LIIVSVIIGIIIVILDSLLDETLVPLLVISGIGFISGIVVLNYKAKHSKRDKGEFRRTNTRSWGV